MNFSGNLYFFALFVFVQHLLAERIFSTPSCITCIFLAEHGATLEDRFLYCEKQQ